MKRLLFLFFLIHSISVLFAQRLEKETEKVIRDLRAQGIDTVITYTVNCKLEESGNTKQAKDSCSATRTRYVFWIKNGISYRQKIDNCKTHAVKKTGYSLFLNTVITHTELIKKSRIKPVEHYIRTATGKRERNEIKVMTTEHSCVTKFIFILGSTTFSKFINHVALETKTMDDQTPNDNYDANQRSILKTLKDLVEKEAH